MKLRPDRRPLAPGVEAPERGSPRSLPVGHPVVEGAAHPGRPALTAAHAQRLWAGLMLLAGILLICVAIGRLGFAARVLGQPGEAEYGEAIIYAQAGRVLRGEPLYRPLDGPPYTVVAYTPLYYGVAAGLRWLLGPGWLPGRMVSYGAALVTAACVGHLARRATGDGRAGVLAAALFVALGFPGRSDPWYALYKEDVLGVALSVTSITLLAGRAGRARVVASGLLAGLAFLTKQTFVAAALAGVIWLWARDRASAGVFASTCLAVVVGTIARLEFLSRSFIANAVLANVVPFSMDALWPGLRVLLHFQAGALALAAGHVLGRQRGGSGWRADLLSLYWAASFLPLAGLAKVGSNYNYWIELAASTAVLATIGTWDALRRRGLWGAAPPLPAAVLLGSLLVVLPSLGRAAVPVLGLAEVEGSRAAELGPVVERVRAQPGPVLADPLDVVALADKEILFEPYLFSILAMNGRWDPEPLIRRICDRQIGLVVLGWPLDAPPTYHGYPYWVAPILEAVRESMVLDSRQAGRFLYAPAPAGVGGRGRCS
jgi:hypothetical protein